MSRPGALALASALGTAGLLALAGCGGGDDARPTTTVRAEAALAVDEIAAAIAAVEEARGGPQRYTEINANVEGVTLFVAVDATSEVDYFYADGVLEPAGAPVARSSPAFALDGVASDIAPELVRATQERFPGATVTALALAQLGGDGVGGGEGAPVWALRSRSARGGVLDVVYSPACELISVAEPG